jgi:hypothetical protein
LEHINPYAVMRSTATLEAYKARQKGLIRAAQPFASIALLCGIFGWAMIAFPATGRWALENLGPVALLIPAGLILVATVCLAIGWLGARRYRRENPIPDEWRQVPRVSWPPGTGQRPPLQ